MRPTYLCVCARARRRRAKREQGREVSLVDSHNWKRRKEHNSWNNGTQTSKRSISRFGKENNNARDAHALSKNFAFFVAFFIACFATTLSTAIIIASPPKSPRVGGWSAVVVVVVSSREMPPTSTSSFLRRLASLIRLRRLFRPPGSRLVICF